MSRKQLTFDFSPKYQWRRIEESPEDREKINGTCLVGSISCTWETLVNTFGLPDSGDGYKVDAEWDIVFKGTTWDLMFGKDIVACIYNWKDGPSSGGPDTRFLTRWNIGGKLSLAKEYVIQAILEKGGSLLPDNE